MEIVEKILKIKVCKSCDDECSKYLDDMAGALNIHDVFNPSFYWSKHLKLLAFRGAETGSGRLMSFVSVEDNSGKTIKNISAEYCNELNCSSLIDPKITKIRDEYYITFNSGWNPDGNEIFIMEIYPEFGTPKRVIYEHRQPQERNWAFFDENGEIYVLYWINPLKILKVIEISPGRWKLVDHYCERKENKNFSGDLTIGTQLSKMGGKYGFVAHKKFYLRGKKIYLGKFCMLDPGEMTVFPGRYWLIHSLRSMLGAKIKTNENLFSCTYFSGIQTFHDTVKLGYGVNDIGYGFCTKNYDEF